MRLTSSDRYPGRFARRSQFTIVRNAVAASPDEMPNKGLELCWPEPDASETTFAAPPYRKVNRPLLSVDATVRRRFEHTISIAIPRGATDPSSTATRPERYVPAELSPPFGDGGGGARSRMTFWVPFPAPELVPVCPSAAEPHRNVAMRTYRVPSILLRNLGRVSRY